MRISPSISCRRTRALLAAGIAGLMVAATTVGAQPAAAANTAGAANPCSRGAARPGVEVPEPRSCAGHLAAPAKTGESPQYVPSPAAATLPNLTQHGGVVMHNPTVSLVFWLPPGTHFTSAGSDQGDATYESVMQRWIQDAGGTDYLNLLTQYYDSTGNIANALNVGGSYVDTRAYTRAGSTTNPLADADITGEISRAVANNGWTEDTNHMVVLFTAMNVQTCSVAANACTFAGGPEKTVFCGYHEHFTGAAGDTLYANMPAADGDGCTYPGGGQTNSQYPNGGSAPGHAGTDAGPDSETGILSHEVAESITDPNGDAWFDSQNQNEEIGDQCNFDPAPRNPSGADVYLHGDPYLVQEQWSNTARACAMDYAPGSVLPPTLSATETASTPSPVAGGSFTYAVTVHNSADTAAATNLTVNAPMPTGYKVTAVSASNGSGSCTAANQGGNAATLSCSTLAVHEAETLTVTTTAGSIAGVTDTACSSTLFQNLLNAQQTSVNSSPCALTTPTATNARVSADAGWDNLWQSYGDSSGQWNGGDGAQSTPLPDGGTAWFFNDSFWGNIASDGTRQLFTNSTPRNMVVVQHGTSMTSIGGPSNPYLNPLNLPGTLVAGPGAYADQSRYNLTGSDAFMDGNTLYKFYTVQDDQGGNTAFPDAPVDNALATFTYNGSTLSLSSTQLLGVPFNGVQWGIAILNDGGYTYLYGDEDIASPLHKYLHLARVPQGQLTSWGAWQYWTGSAWSPSPAASARMMDWVSDGFSVEKINGVYVLLTADTSTGLSGNVAVYYAATPWGFDGSGKQIIYVPQLGSGIIQYEYRIHPQFSSGSDVLVGYSTDTLNIDDACMSQNDLQARIYRPRFLDVQLPNLPAPSGPVTSMNVGAPPAYPDAPKVTPDEETWHVTDPSATSYSTTHCGYSNPAAPPKPSLSVSANYDASADLAWHESPIAMWVYNVRYHDDTADPNWNNPPSSDPNCANASANGGWCTMPYPLEGDTGFKMQYLPPLHHYEVTVSAGCWRSNCATWSDPVKFTVNLAPPSGIPTNVKVTPGDANATITFTDTTPNVWYVAWFSDSLGDLPIASVPGPMTDRTFTWHNIPPGKSVFWITENNQAGNGPDSAHVTATVLACNPVQPCG